MIKDHLTDLEISKIEQFCSDEAMYSAVKKIVLAAMYYDGALRKGEELSPRNQAFNLIATTLHEGHITNEGLGENLRALFSGVNLLEEGFSYLKTIKQKQEKVEPEYNEAI